MMGNGNSRKPDDLKNKVAVARRLSEIADSPTDTRVEPTISTPTHIATENCASLEEAIESLQLQFDAHGPGRIKLRGDSRIPTATPAAATPDNGGGFGASDVLIIVIGLVLGGAIAVLFF